MKIRKLHPWKVSYRDAIEIQRTLRPKIILKTLSGAIRYVGGTDISSSKKSNKVWAGIVVLSYPELRKVDESWLEGATDFPYIPGLLSFREIPFLLKALKQLRREPDLIFCDGQGIAHPRGLGLASHLGLLTGKPTIGCAKTRLVGEFSEVGKRRGDYSLLSYEGKTVGAVVRTKTNVKPLFISPGYAVTLEDALAVTLNCGGAYRIPEPTRQAHLLVTRLRREEGPIS